MSLRKTLLVLVVFVLLGGTIYFHEIGKAPVEKGERLVDLEENEIAGITLNYRDLDVQLSREASGEWVLTQPLRTPADPSTVAAIVSALRSSKIERIIETEPGPEDLEAFGLDKPWAELHIRSGKGKALGPILVGAQTPIGYSAYVKRGEDPAVLLTSAALRSSLDKRLFDFRDKRIVALDPDDVKRITLDGPRGRFVLTRKDAEWLIDEPAQERADQAEVGGMLSALRNLRARDFVAETSSDLEKYGLDKPRLRITVVTGDEDRQRELLFGDERDGKGEVYLNLDAKGTVYAVDESAFKLLDKELSTLKDKEVLAIDAERVGTMKFDHSEGSFVLVRGAQGDWKVDGPVKGKASKRAVSGYLTMLSRLRANGFGDDRPDDLKRYGLDPPLIRITLEGTTSEEIATLLVGKKFNGGFYAKRAGNRNVYTIEESLYDRIDKRAGDFLEEKKEKQPANRAEE